ncbi:MAG: hypothetical protein JRN34_05045 [Nitrososphaerota archaeon]|nr:hypothetical protein [Nitrososphaerota archaeon]MDG6942275.1 hypothetical protein [Nitrososphaerota archaeon]MDG6942740.1 hypothetical protein [Nitrososphaerota archaeon]MDG6948527.1 hypothetical protein [Nitrososphaerota archaeon]MDG6950453.1 hypothetical protein [Nitrososphaerota archaeon]
MGKVFRDVERIHNPVEVDINPGSPEIIIKLALEGADVVMLAGSIYDYIGRRRKKAPELQPPAIDTGFLVQLTSYRLREITGQRSLVLEKLAKSEVGTSMTFVDESGNRHACTIDSSGEIVSYDGPSFFSPRHRKHKD